jgi:hypothetical protein
MSAQHDISDAFAWLLSLDFRFINNLKRNTENLSILNVLFMFYTTHMLSFLCILVTGLQSIIISNL